MSRILSLGLVASLALAGCLQLPEQADDLPDEIDAAVGDTMTASETKDEGSGLCTDGGLNLGGGGDDRFCATRTVTVEGKLLGFPAMEVLLDTFNGAVTLHDAREGTWGFVATMKARGSSADAAMAKLDEIAFSWSHEDATGHFVQVIAELDEAENVEASIDLTMPRSVLLQIVADTSNGNIELTNLRASAVALSTSNGLIRAVADVGQASLDTSNGNIEAELTPISSARWNLDTSNGNIALKVPEGPRYGYSFEGDTSNGEVKYGLRDGEQGPCPEGSEYYTPPCNERTFETNGFRTRDLQVHAVLDTSNGEISADPA